MLDAVGGCSRVVYLGTSATEADDVNPLPTMETEGTTSAGEDGAFITLTDAVKEKSEVIRIAEATARAVAERVDEEGPSVTNQAIRIEKIVADAVMPKLEVVSKHTNTEVGAVDVNEESEVPAKVKVTQARIEVGNVDTTEVSAKVKATRAGIEEGNVDTTEATFTTSIPIVTGNVEGKQSLDNTVEELIVRIQNAGTEVVEAKVGAGSVTLSMAYTATKFAESCMRTLDGDSDVYECA
jgi:hypothetical protein